jgi:hypothetical protein
MTDNARQSNTLIWDDAANFSAALPSAQRRPLLAVNGLPAAKKPFDSKRREKVLSNIDQHAQSLAD